MGSGQVLQHTRCVVRLVLVRTSVCKSRIDTSITEKNRINEDNAVYGGCPIFLHLELGACAALARSLRAHSLAHNGFAQAHHTKTKYHERFRTLAPTLRRACAELVRAGFLTNYVTLGFRLSKIVDKGFRTTLI